MAAILIVDDEEGIREFLTDALDGEGHELAQAGDGDAAIQCLRAQPFDLMITDLRMPGRLDGVELLREARRERPGLEVVVLTAHGTVASAVEAMKLGAFDYLEKPIGSPRQLRVLVWRALARRRLAAGAAAEGGRTTPVASADPVAQLAAGVERALGPEYVVEEAIGRGGYAIVFRVHDRRLDRKLAAKALYPELAAVPAIADKFRREARTAAQLAHANIVPVYFVGGEGDVPCLVMPLVDGEPLSARLQRDGKLDLAAALRVGRDVAAALDCAHRAGVIHRDVKPDNILVERATGRSLLTDFGIAKALVGDSMATAPGVVLGTPHYLSPEQAMGGWSLDARSDVYSFGVVMYEMLAGRPPFDGGDPRSVLASHVTTAAPPLRRHRPEVSRKAAAVIARALAKHPGDRYATAGELVAALERAASGGGAVWMAPWLTRVTSRRRGG